MEFGLAEYNTEKQIKLVICDEKYLKDETEWLNIKCVTAALKLVSFSLKHAICEIHGRKFALKIKQLLAS